MSAGRWLNATIGPYRLVEFVGAGGMGEVYRAVDVRTARVMAVKLLTSARNAPALLERFRNEARIQGTLKHPHIATMHEFIEQGDVPAIVMEYVDGDTLDERVHRRGALPFGESLTLALPVIDAVHYLHQRGIVHRDLKTNNVKVSTSGVVKLLDFGIAKAPHSPQLTADGSVIGTLQSLSPEVLEGSPADTRSDIWSLGVMLYELITGTHPFMGDGAEGISRRIRAGKYPAPTRVHAGLPAAADRIISRCLQVDPKARYRSAELLLADVRAQLEPPAPKPLIIKPRVSGEVLLKARSHAPLAAAIGAAVVALGFLVSTISAPSRDGPTGDSAAVVVPHTPADTTIHPIADDTGPDARDVTVNTMEGSAEVWSNGQLVGRTPYHMRRTIGSGISLILKRPGYEDEPVQFDVTEGRSEYSIVMKPRAGAKPSSSLPPSPPGSGVALFGLSVGSWFRRRRNKGGDMSTSGSASAPTREFTTAPVSRIDSAMASDPGCVREQNEDSLALVGPDGDNRLLAVVCDGMGGHAAGEMASKLAVEVISRAFSAGNGGDAGDALARSVKQANRTIYDAAHHDAQYTGMGTTCTAIVMKQGMVWCAHVGDSRCYLLRSGDIFCMTEDHSAVMAMVREGAISRDEARHHPDKNVISRALGSHADVQVSTWPQPFVARAGDRFLLCSDGLYDVVTDDELRAAAGMASPDQACRDLIALARERGGPDNISVIVLSLPAPSRETRPVDAVA